MKKVRKIIFIIAIILVSLVAVYTLYMVYATWLSAYNTPSHQPNSKWISEDKAIYFEVDDNGIGYGTMTVNNETIDIEVSTASGSSIIIYRADGSIDGVSGNRSIEFWYGSFLRRDRFTVRVHKSSPYYQNNEEFEMKFYRIDE